MAVIVPKNRHRRHLTHIAIERISVDNDILIWPSRCTRRGIWTLLRNSKVKAGALPSAIERKLERTMLSHCANLQCSRPFLLLGQGRLFLMETGCATKLDQTRTSRSVLARHQPRRVERYWLCDQCSQVWTLIHDRNQKVGLFPLPQAAESA
jgi:hypothetical protein